MSYLAIAINRPRKGNEPVKRSKVDEPQGYSVKQDNTSMATGPRPNQGKADAQAVRNALGMKHRKSVKTLVRKSYIKK